MRKILIAAAAGLTIVAASSLTAPLAEAMPLALPLTNQFNIDEQVALCFYIDGWNGPGMYECGYRHRRGFGWHGPRSDERGRELRHEDRGRELRHEDRRRDLRIDDRRRY